MRTQSVIKVVDATKTQGRVILRLKCGHNVSPPDISIRELKLILDGPNQWTWECPFCPDEAGAQSGSNIIECAGCGQAPTHRFALPRPLYLCDGCFVGLKQVLDSGSEGGSGTTDTAPAAALPIDDFSEEEGQ